jgi:LacI family transcriptional regulator
MQSKETPTIREVARKASVSVATVSRVLNGVVRVSPTKEQAVREAMKELGFSPSLLSKWLSTGNSNVIGIISQDVSGYYYGMIHEGIASVMNSSSYQAVFTNGQWQAEQDLKVVELISHRWVDGLIFLDSQLPDAVLREVAERLPTVIFGRKLAGLEHRCLTLDNEQIGYLGTQHLLQLGHRAVAHIAGPASHADASERLKGYKRALQEHKIAFDPQLVVAGDYTEHSGLLGVETLLARQVLFTAIFAADDAMAFGAGLGLYNHGLRVPDDVSLVGVDDLPMSKYTIPPLSTVAYPVWEMGQETARAVLAMLDGQPYTLPNFSATLIRRDSTAVFRGTRLGAVAV